MNAVLSIKPLGFPWETADPFLFCVYHDDRYPRANAQMGPDVSLAGRQLGQDFSRNQGFSMYHGMTVPGFPAHPHRGFETVTIVRKGLIDHADSLGAAARFGRGDVQWLTAGEGVVHSEMFPLLDRENPNPLELFQIWLNLPARSKRAKAHFTMLWSEAIPRELVTDTEGRTTEVAVVAGRLGPIIALPPPPDSWAAQADSDVAILTLRMSSGAQWTLPGASGKGARRTLYFFKGQSISVAGTPVTGPAAIEVDAARDIELMNGDGEGELLVLQGRPIGEPVVQHGPFVMNTQAEIVATFADYRRTQFGGWPWPDAAPVHGGENARFARHPDGREEHPGT